MTMLLWTMLLSEVLPTIEVEKQPVYMSGQNFDKGKVRLPATGALHLSLVELVGKSLDFFKWASHYLQVIASGQVITHKTKKIICLSRPPRATVSITWDVSSLKMLNRI